MKALAQLTPEEFALVCYLVLMQNGGGIIDKSPDYVSEKKDLLHMGYLAFRALDIYNMRKVVHWCHEWHVEIPPLITEELALQEQAMQDLIQRGIEL